MARSKDTILTQLFNSKANQTALAILTSTSSVAWWLLMLDVIATGINFLEQLWDVKKAEFEAIIDKAPVHSTKWLKQRLLEYQDGYDVEVRDDFTVGYATLDKSAQIITFAGVQDQYALNNNFGGNGLTFSVASGTTPTPVTNTQLTNIKNYISQFIKPGVPYDVRSSAADLLKITCEVKFDARYYATIQTSVFDAIRNYIQNLDSLLLDVDTLFARIKEVEGVKSIVMTEVVARQSAGLPQTIFQSIPSNSVPATATQIWNSTFSYMVEETNTGDGWANTITFTPVS